MSQIEKLQYRRRDTRQLHAEICYRCINLNHATLRWVHNNRSSGSILIRGQHYVGPFHPQLHAGLSRRFQPDPR